MGDRCGFGLNDGGAAMTDHATSRLCGKDEEEARRWRELGVVDAEGDEIAGNWAPLALPESEQAPPCRGLPLRHALCAGCDRASEAISAEPRSPARPAMRHGA